jgi:glycosyltransferase involved in cell wall biosynthesis
MKIAFISRATLYSSPGGDTTQLDETAAGLRRLGVQVDIYLTSQEIDYSRYDLLHFFNIIRPADILRHTGQTKVPYLISTIFVEYDNIPGEGAIRSALKKVIGSDGIEYVKVLARRLKNGERIRSVSYLLTGHRRSIQRAAAGAAMLLPNSASEYRRFAARYRMERPYRVVPNGIKTDAVTGSYPDAPQYRDSVICMARVEPRKNQLRLLHALKGTGRKLFIHGKASPNHSAYHAACMAGTDEHMQVLGWLDGDALYAAYGSAKVHVLPSFFETTGLSSLEAAVMGCNIVITDRGDTRDYFGDDAWYCEPENPESIREAVIKAAEAPYNPAFRERILRDFTWDRAAEETLKAYQEILRP